MTILGKILVFINLIFSLMVGFLVIMVYIARTNYFEENKKLAQRMEVAQVASVQAQAARTKAEVDLGNYVKEAESKLKASEALLKTKVDEVERLNGLFTADRKKYEELDAAVQAATEAVKRRQADVDKMRETLKTEMEKNVELVKTTNNQRDLATAAQLQASALLDRNKQLEGQLQDMAKDLARSRQSGPAGSPPGGTLVSKRNPPLENVEGLVKTTDASTGLVKITIGSDAGLTRGHTLEVFRLASIPSQSKYLGTIRILEVTANEAVGQPTGRPLTPIQPGDRVASRILGS